MFPKSAENAVVLLSNNRLQNVVYDIPHERQFCVLFVLLLTPHTYKRVFTLKSLFYLCEDAFQVVL